MATITYTPIDPVLMISGQLITDTTSTTGAGAGLQTVGIVDRWIATTYSPPLFVSQLGQGGGTSIPGASTNAGSGSPDTLARFLIRGNATRRTITISCWVLVSAGSTTGTLTFTHGGVSVQVTTTSTTAALGHFDITPSSGSSPLELLIQGHTDNSNYVYLMAASARMKEADSFAGGVGADGYANFGSLPAGAAYLSTSPMAYNKPISTELMGRGYNNMRALARDRIACVATMQRPQNVTGSRQDWTTNETDQKLVGFFDVPPIERVERQGVISIYTTNSGDATGLATILIDGSQSYTTASSAGASAWAHHTISLPKDGCNVALYCKQTGGTGYTGITAAQIWRAI